MTSEQEERLVVALEAIAAALQSRPAYQITYNPAPTKVPTPLMPEYEPYKFPGPGYKSPEFLDS